MQRLPETGPSETSSTQPLSLMSTSPWCPCPAGCDVLRASALEKKKTEKENFIEMAEGTTTLKGLRAQMGKNYVGSRGYFCPSCVLQCSNDFVMFACNYRL